MEDRYISLIAKYLSGDLEDNEREVLFELVNSSEEHKSYFEEMQSLWEISEVEDDFEVDTDAAWSKVSDRIKPQTEIPKIESRAKVFQIGQLLKIAAVFIAVLGAVWIYRNFDEKPSQIAFFETINEEQKELKLPDGSTVWLNENSKLSYDEKFEPRIVKLEGEAFFDVQHLDNNSKFEILSGATKTTVLGTSFNVRAYPKEEQVEVTVETGKVAFEKDIVKTVEQKVILLAGESGVYNKQKADVVKPKKMINNAVAWKKGKLVFDDDKMSDVKTVLERYFDIEIKMENDNILDCPLNGTYPNPEIEKLIPILEMSLDIKITQNENMLTFSGKGCE